MNIYITSELLTQLLSVARGLGTVPKLYLAKNEWRIISEIHNVDFPVTFSFPG